MNFNLFDDMDGLILRERENSLSGHSPSARGYSKSSADEYSGNTSAFPKNTPLAMAYVPFQQWGSVFNEDDALDCGTLFPDLRFPFLKGGSQ